MILNTTTWQQTINEAKAKSAGKPAILRAIDRAVIEISRSKYWSFDGQTLRLQSTTSTKLYIVEEGHTCDAQSKTCKHHIARRLMLRYTQALGVAAAEVETKRASVKPSMLAEASQAVMANRRVRGEMRNGMDV